MSLLFLGDLPFPPTKAKLMDEIEQKLNMNTWEKKTELKTHMVVDVMSKLRQMSFVKNDSLGNFLKSCLNSTLNISEQAECLHLVQDSYIEQSLKEFERMKRSDGTQGLEIIDMSSETLVPVVPEKFWASEENKRKIQLLFCVVIHFC